MIAAPPYDATTIAALEEQTSTLLSEFRAYGAERVEHAIVQPADAFLDRMGEELRRRTYVFAGPDGSELCLRPDLTIPTAQTYLARNPNCDQALKLCYAGPVFRHDPSAPDQPGQSFQAGVESFNASDAATADVEALLLTHSAVTKAGLPHTRVTIGDVGLFQELLDAMSLPAHWAAKIRRRAWQPDRLRELLQRLSGPAEPGSEFLSHIGKLPPEQARDVLHDSLQLSGIKPIGTRTLDEITERFLERAADAAAPRLSPESAELIEAFLAIKRPASRAIRAIQNLVRPSSISIDPALFALKRRLDKLLHAGCDTSDIEFETQFGRNMEYYSGFVFELRSPEAIFPLAGGGRYDNLLCTLGSLKKTPAIGLAVFAERLAAAKAATS